MPQKLVQQMGQLSFKYESSSTSIFTAFADLYFCSKYFAKIEQPNLLQEGGGANPHEYHSNSYNRSPNQATGRSIFQFDFSKSRDLVNQDSSFRNQIAASVFKDLYTAFYYVILFWYLFILTILR